MGGVSGYITRRQPPHLRFLRRKQPSVQFIAWSGTVLVPISQGTEVTKVTEYVPFRYFTRTASQMSEMDTPVDHAQEEEMPLVEWALTLMGHCNPEEEYIYI